MGGLRFVTPALIYSLYSIIFRQVWRLDWKNPWYSCQSKNYRKTSARIWQAKCLSPLLTCLCLVCTRQARSKVSNTC